MKYNMLNISMSIHETFHKVFFYLIVTIYVNIDSENEIYTGYISY